MANFNTEYKSFNLLAYFPVIFGSNKNELFEISILKQTSLGIDFQSSILDP